MLKKHYLTTIIYSAMAAIFIPLSVQADEPVAKSPVYALVNAFPPFTMLNKSGQATGFEVDLAKIIGKNIHVSPVITLGTFQNNMLGLQSGRVDIASMASILPGRTKTLDFVPYMYAGYGFVTRKNGPDISSDISHGLCGYKIGVIGGDPSQALLNKINTEHCSAKPFLMVPFGDGTAIAEAVQSRRVDAWVCPAATCGYQAKLNTGSWKITGPTFISTTVGIATRKGSGWSEKIAEGLRAAVKSGEYQQLMARYGLENLSVPLNEIHPISDASQLTKAKGEINE